MGLLNPGALYYLLALIPALALAYLVRERPRRVVVSSVLAFRALRARRGQRFGGWPRPDWMFFVEMLIIALAVLAIAGPYVTRNGQSDRGGARRLGGDAGRGGLRTQPLRHGARGAHRCARARRPGRGQPLSDRPAASSRRSAIRERCRSVGGARTVASRRRAVRPGRADRALERACFRHAPSPGDLCRRAAACGAGAAAGRGVRGRRSAAQLRDRIVRAAPRIVGTGRAARPLDGRQLQSRRRRRCSSRSPATASRSDMPRRIWSPARSARSSFPTSRRPGSIARSLRRPTASRSTTSPGPPPARSNQFRYCS